MCSQISAQTEENSEITGEMWQPCKIGKKEEKKKHANIARHCGDTGLPPEEVE